MLATSLLGRQVVFTDDGTPVTIVLVFKNKHGFPGFLVELDDGQLWYLTHQEFRLVPLPDPDLKKWTVKGTT